jgi:hypothetical protein
MNVCVTPTSSSVLLCILILHHQDTTELLSVPLVFIFLLYKWNNTLYIPLYIVSLRIAMLKFIHVAEIIKSSVLLTLSSIPLCICTTVYSFTSPWRDVYVAFKLVIFINKDDKTTYVQFFCGNCLWGQIFRIPVTRSSGECRSCSVLAAALPLPTLSSAWEFLQHLLCQSWLL